MTELQQQGWLVIDEPASTTTRMVHAECNQHHDIQHQSKVRSYRGIPETVDVQVKAIAKEMKVPVGEVMRVLLEYALTAYEAGEMLLNPQPRIVRSERNKTLFPDS